MELIRPRRFGNFRSPRAIENYRLELKKKKMLAEKVVAGIDEKKKTDLYKTDTFLYRFSIENN